MITAVKNKKGQALIETLFMLPFIVAVILVAYQAYILINKNVISQKYLKSVVVGRLLNRFDITTESVGVPPSGKYYYRFAESKDTEFMTYEIDKSTAELLTAFLTDTGTKESLVERLTAGKKGFEALGLCVGGGALMNDQVSPDVFNLNTGDTCSKK